MRETHESKEPAGASRPSRPAAERHLLVTLLSFAVSVSATRLFLTLTGYPTIGGGELPIAHVLWGGLLLFGAALLPLIFANTWVYTFGALLAPIIYTFFLLIVLLLVNLRRLGRETVDPDLCESIGTIREALDRPLRASEKTDLKARLERVGGDAVSEKRAELARALLAFVEAGGRAEESAHRREPRWRVRLRPQGGPRPASDRSLRLALAVGICAIGLLTLKNPAGVLLADWLPPEAVRFLEGSYAGRRIEATAAPFWPAARLALECSVGALLLASAGFLTVGLSRLGSALGFAVLLLSLTTVNLLLFYFEQFSTVVTTMLQFVLLLGVLHYRSRLRTTPSIEGVPNRTVA
jgi:hypothetical protein